MNSLEKIVFLNFKTAWAIMEAAGKPLPAWPGDPESRLPAVNEREIK